MVEDNMENDTSIKLQVGDWREVYYDDKVYPGEVIGDEFLVKAMEQIGRFWKWANVD